MPNSLLTADVIAREALMVLEANMVMGGLVHRDYDNEFVADVGDTVTIRKPAKFVAHNFTDHITRQDASEGKASVKLDHWRDVSFDVTSRDLTMNITNFSEQFIAPAMRAIAQALDEDILNEEVNVTNTVNGTANATDLKDIANISKKLDINKVPQQLRRLVFNPVNRFAALNYQSVIYINFVEEPKYKTITADGYKAKDIVKNISRLDPLKSFIPNETLIFF